MARLLRDFVLIIFGFIVTLMLPVVADLVNKPHKFSDTLVILLLAILMGGPYAFLLYRLGKAEERQQERRDKKLVEETLKGLGYGHRDSDSNHLDSIL